MAESIHNPAERAAEEAIQQVYGCIKDGTSFRLEAGAGAGKTYSLISALRYLIDNQGPALLRRCQRIACITYTNTAKAEIESRTDRHPVIYCDTIHGFCWSMIKDLQSQLRKELPDMERWRVMLDESGGVGNSTIQYTLGYRRIDTECLSLHHDDVLTLFAALMSNRKFRILLTTRHPFLFIDEYQDMNAGFADSLKAHCLDKEGGPLIGLFGDHWQKIYRDVCGKLEHPKLTGIGKKSNFRSVKAVVDVLNRMRSELPQEVKDPNAKGSAVVYHTNDWPGQRRSEAHWKGDLPADTAHDFLQNLREKLTKEGWTFTPDKTRILMLTHSVLAKEQGYSSLANVFPYNDSFIEKTDPHISFFVDTVEPVCRAYESKRFGEMLAALGDRTTAIQSHSDKLKWAEDMEGLLNVRKNGTIGDVVDYLRKTQRPHIPEAVEDRERHLEATRENPESEEPPQTEVLRELRKVRYEEVVALRAYLEGNTPFATKHGVKGAEFENVLVVVGRGWNLYNFNQMLELAKDPRQIPSGKWDAFERARNLFYVACSRPQKRLALLFTQELSKKAMETLANWFGEDSIRSLGPAPGRIS
jgi:DNA helicase-2/ATP-dependent DNA helicase PcrA